MTDDSVIIIVVLYFLSVKTMSKRSYNLRPRAKTRSQSETRQSFGHEPSTLTGRTESPTTPTGEKRPAPGQHPVPEVVGIAPRSEMGSRPVLALVWLENAYSRPFLGSFWGTFPPNDVTHRPNPKRTILGLNHVI